MVIGNRPKEMDLIKLHRLYAWIGVERNYRRIDTTGWHVVELAVMWPFKLAGDGEYYTREHFHGFIWRFQFWFPIDSV